MTAMGYMAPIWLVAARLQCAKTQKKYCIKMLVYSTLQQADKRHGYKENIADAEIIYIFYVVRDVSYLPALQSAGPYKYILFGEIKICNRQCILIKNC